MSPKRQRYVIDGYNVAHALRGGPLRRDELESARAHLVRLLRPLADRRTAVTIVFDSRLGAKDGSRPRGVPGIVEVAYAADADAAIVELIRGSGSPGSCVVVSRDRAVAGRAAQLGAEVVKVERLLELIRERGGGSDLTADADPLEPPEKYGAGGGGDDEEGGTPRRRRE
jgi:hypothetical protein